MYLAETGQASEEAVVAQKAKMLGLNPALALKKYHEIQRAMAQAPSKAEFLKATLASAKKEHKEALETLAALREKAKKVKDASKKAQVLHAIDKEEQRLRRVGRLLGEGEGMRGLGFAWFAVIMGVVLAGITIAGYVEFRQQVKKTVEETGSAIITLTYVTAIGGGVLMLLYMGKLFRDAYGEKEGALKRARA